MDINFPLVLVCAVVITGVAWWVDGAWLHKRRVPDAPSPWWAETAKSFFPVLVLVLVVRSFVIEPFKIPSSSMVPTLLVGDYILVNKFAYGLRLPVTNTKVLATGEPKRGDVMVFFPPHDSRYFIKRVVGLPGDEIRYLNHQLYINGEPVPRKYLGKEPENSDILSHYLFEESIDPDRPGYTVRDRRYPSALEIHQPFRVPEGYYYMMGDNRDLSSDSRVWGPVPEENIVGQAFAVWLHWERFWSLPKFDRIRRVR